MGRLTGKVAIVTGAANGLGRTYARALAAEGAHLSLCDVVDASALVAELRATGAQAVATVCDVSDSAMVAATVRATEEAFGAIHILVNNAALMGPAAKPLDEITTGEWDRLMAVNARGPFEFVKAVLPAMRRQRYGKIVNISSGMVFKGSPYLLHYVASKGAIIGMTRAMARELAADGIGVNCIAPGLVPTDGAKAVAQGATQQAAIDTRSIKREQTPDDLVGALLFFASAESDFVTGQTIVVDGGSSMH
jgi:NAD(P)-dependent dehydrogenase (short-subunit alcohol dehydrogenase family)